MAFVGVPVLFPKYCPLHLPVAKRCQRTLLSSPVSRALPVSAIAERSAKPALRKYLGIIRPKRKALASRRAMVELRTADTTLTLAFYLYMSSRGIRMTKKVEEWIRRAGERCKELGMHQLGDTLLQHSREESGHDQMYEQDTRQLAIRWNAMFPQNTVDAERLIGADYLHPGEYAYHEVHENVVDSSKPFLQVAIAHEIERLSIVELPDMLRMAAERVGSDVLKDLSFLTSHHDIDIHHADENEVQMGKLFDQFPSDAETLAETGGLALQAFGDYLDDCMVLAKELVHRNQ